MHVDRVEFDGFEPMERGAAARLCDGTDPDTIGPPGGSVSLVSQDGRLRVSLLGAPQAQRPALIAAIRLLLRMPEFRGGALRLTFARTLPLSTRKRR